MTTLLALYFSRVRGIALFIVLLSSVSAIEAATCSAVPSGLVGWWPGDVNENDIAGSNNPSGVAAITLVPGEVLTGFSFGTSGYIQIPSSPSLSNEAFTWSVWAKPEGPGPNNDGFGAVILLQNIDSLHNAVGLHWRATDNRFLFDFGDVRSEIFTSTDAFRPGNFYHVAATYDGLVYRLYVNGNPEGSFTEAKTVPYSPSGWTFGSSPPSFFSAGSYRTWNGVLDEIQAFNRALTPAEVQSIYAAGTAGACKGPGISSGGVISAGAFGGYSSVAPGDWIEIYGSGFASESRSWGGADFTGVAAPISLDGTKVTIGGQSAFVDFISPTQVNALIPSNVPLGLQQITVTNAVGISSPFTIMVNDLQPGLLAPSSFIVNGVPYAVALFADGTYVLPTGAIPGINSRPANPGETIVLYGVGFGPVIPSIPAGQLVQQANNLASGFQVFIGGVPAMTSYAGLAPNYTGLYQFNIVVPNVAGNMPLTFTLAGTPGTQKLNIAVGN